MSELEITAAASAFADEAVPDAHRHNAPYYTTLDRWEDMRESFIEGARWMQAHSLSVLAVMNAIGVLQRSGPDKALELYPDLRPVIIRLSEQKCNPHD